MYSGHSASSEIRRVDRVSDQPRIGLFSLRQLHKQVYRSSLYEFEDVIAASENVDLIEAVGLPPRLNWLNLKLERYAERYFNTDIFPGTRFKPQPLEGHYDLLIVICQKEDDLRYLRRIPDWRKHCTKAVCWIDELWASRVEKYPRQLELLADFDAVFLGFSTTLPVVQRRLAAPCYHLPVGADTLAFNPFPQAPERTIDLYSMGRRAPITHAMMLEMARTRGLFYMYDSAPLGSVTKPIEHRRMLSSLIQRTRLFLVAPAKVTSPHETQGQTEVGTRYFEGAAGGAILVGERPNLPAFDQDFDWPDAVVHLAYNSDDPTQLLELLADPRRMRAIHERNASQSLRRHDWAYRWRDMLLALGMPLPRNLQQRIQRCQDAADRIDRNVSPLLSGHALFR
jgi:hypothetical protein